jgi:hypothetical protein
LTLIGDIRGKGDGLASDLVFDFLQKPRSPTNQSHSCPFPGKGQGCRAPDSASSTGDDRHLAHEALAHRAEV